MKPAIPPGVVIAVTGLPGSGKSLVARTIASELGLEVRVMGDVVRREAMRRGLELTPENVEQVARELRNTMGRGAVAILLSGELDPGSSYVVDGLRSLEEAEVFRRRGWKVYIVGVHASRRIRVERLRTRGRPGEDSEKALVLRDMSNLELGVGEALAMADYIIVNDGSVDDLRMEAARIARVIACEEDKSRG